MRHLQGLEGITVWSLRPAGLGENISDGVRQRIPDHQQACNPERARHSGIQDAHGCAEVKMEGCGEFGPKLRLNLIQGPFSRGQRSKFV